MRRASGRRPRFTIIVVLVASMVLTLFARLYYVQLLDPNKPTQTAGLLHPGDVVIPAPRGLIVDSTGHVLVDNTSVQVMTIDQDRLDALPDHGAAVLGPRRRLAAQDRRRRSPSRDHPVLAEGAGAVLDGRAVPAGAGRDAPVAAVVLAVTEHREDFPGVTIQTVTLPRLPQRLARRPRARLHRRRSPPRTSGTTRSSPTPTRSGSPGSRSSTTACCAASTASS